jgi:hypothetical protein
MTKGKQMAKDLGSQTVTIVKQERTCRVEIFCDLGNVPIVCFHRQIIMDDGVKPIISSEGGRIITRSAKELAEMSVKVGNATYTGAELAAVIAAFGDAIAADQDAKNEAAAKEAE